MDLPFWKNMSQGLVFLGAFFVIVGQIGVWLINNKIAANEKAHIANITAERDQAIEELKRLSTDNILLTEFSGALDNRIQNIYLELDFKKSTIDKYFSDFYCYMLLGALDVCYEIISAPPNPLGMGHKITAYTAHYSKAFESEEKEWEMWHLLPPDQMSLALFHHGFLSIHPFLDGNGRVARAILQQQAFELTGRYVEATFTEDPAAYFESLSDADAGDPSSLIRLIRANLE